MKTLIPIAMMSALALSITSAGAGELNVAGHLNVASNLTAHAVTLGGETRTNWPSGSAASGAVDLTSPLLDFSQPGQFFQFTLTNNATWVFTNHVAGRELWLQVVEDATGGWTNAWPSNLLWPGGQRVNGSTSPNYFSVFKFLDDGQHWLAQSESVDYSTPCTNNCSYALQFDSQSGSAITDSTSAYSLSGSGSITVEAWLKTTFTTYGGYWFVMHYPNDGSREGWYLILDNESVTGAVFWQHDGYGGNNGPDMSVGSVNASVGIADGQWHHVAATYNGSVARMFVDGTLVDSQTYSGTFTAVSRELRLNSERGGQFPFQIDELRISRVARYSSSFTPSTSFTVDSDTLGYWKFNEGSGGTAHDETSSHDFTSQSSPGPTWVEGR